MTKITIVIPCYNHGHFLLEALQSLTLCDRDLYQVVIVNDGSTDGDTLAILAQLQDQGYFIHHQTNNGLANARNQGIKLANTPYILPLDCDNKIRPNYLTKSIAILDQQPNIDVVYGNVHYFGEQDLVWALPDFDLVHLLARNYIDACAVFRKTTWQKVGGYDEQIPDRLGYEDWDFWLSVAEQGGGILSFSRNCLRLPHPIGFDGASLQDTPQSQPSRGIHLSQTRKTLRPISAPRACRKRIPLIQPD